MRVRILDEAWADLRAIEFFIKQQDPAAAQRVTAAIVAMIGRLDSFPYLGRTGRGEGTREISVPGFPYFIVYTLPDAQHVDIEAVFHVRQLYPPQDT